MTAQQLKEQIINKQTLIPLGLVVMIVAAAVTAAFTFGSDRSAVSAHLQQHDQRIDDHETRLKTVEKTVAGLKGPIDQLNKNLERLMEERENQ